MAAPSPPTPPRPPPPTPAPISRPSANPTSPPASPTPPPISPATDAPRSAAPAASRVAPRPSRDQCPFKSPSTPLASSRLTPPPRAPAVAITAFPSRPSTRLGSDSPRRLDWALIRPTERGVPAGISALSTAGGRPRRRGRSGTARRRFWGWRPEARVRVSSGRGRSPGGRGRARRSVLPAGGGRLAGIDQPTREPPTLPGEPGARRRDRRRPWWRPRWARPAVEPGSRAARVDARPRTQVIAEVEEHVDERRPHLGRSLQAARMIPMVPYRALPPERLVHR